jgi:hypothetical protein
VRAKQLALGLPKQRSSGNGTCPDRRSGERRIAKSTDEQSYFGYQMASQPTKDVDKGRVLPFRPSAPKSWNARLRLYDQSRSPISDLSKFSRGPEEDDYPHRIFMNLLAFLVLSFIVGCGIWLADNMSERNKDQDCRLISRTYRVPIPGPSDTR